MRKPTKAEVLDAMEPHRYVSLIVLAGRLDTTQDRAQATLDTLMAGGQVEMTAGCYRRV